MSTPMSSQNRPLAQRHIGIPESRQLDLFAAMLERRGATVTRCPLVGIHDTPDTEHVRTWLADVASRGLDTMIWLTGEGVRRIHGFAEREGLAAALTGRLAKARQVTRGPKPVSALRQLGLQSDVQAPRPITAGVIEALDDYPLTETRLGVQLYGTDPNRPLMDYLAERGAIALPVAPYAYSDASDDAAVLDFLKSILAGELDAVAFTSSQQVKRLFAIARANNQTQALAASLANTCVAAVGPLVVETLNSRDIAVSLMPEQHYFMKPLVRALADYFATR